MPERKRWEMPSDEELRRFRLLKEPSWETHPILSLAVEADKEVLARFAAPEIARLTGIIERLRRVVEAVEEPILVSEYEQGIDTALAALQPGDRGEKQ